MQHANYQILSEQEHFLIVIKPSGLPTVPLARDPEGDSLLTSVSQEYPEILQGVGKNFHEGMILHRLDTETCGLVLIARSEKFYSHMQDVQISGMFVKQYWAAVAPMPVPEGFPEKFPRNYREGEMIIESWFRPFGIRGQAVRPVVSSSSHFALQKRGSAWYTTRVRPGGSNQSGHQVMLCELNRGFRHQVRAHLAWAGTPIIGDSLYGGMTDDSLRLAAIGLTFPHLNSDEAIHIQWQPGPDWALKA